VHGLWPPLRWILLSCCASCGGGEDPVDPGEHQMDAFGGEQSGMHPHYTRCRSQKVVWAQMAGVVHVQLDRTRDGFRSRGLATLGLEETVGGTGDAMPNCNCDLG
jgi:hypothetical protein